ncbi:uncharacterized protein DEA37_0010189, partial [Paragonimus westermani]
MQESGLLVVGRNHVANSRCKLSTRWASTRTIQPWLFGSFSSSSCWHAWTNRLWWLVQHTVCVFLFAFPYQLPTVPV